LPTYENKLDLDLKIHFTRGTPSGSINHKCIKSSTITVTKVAPKAIISSQYVRPDLKVLERYAARATNPAAIIGTYIIYQHTTKHHANDATAAVIAAAVCTVPSNLLDRNAGAAPTKQIAAQAKKANTLRLVDHGEIISPSSNQAGNNVNPIVPIIAGNTIPRCFFFYSYK
jgi:hypothetical protein